MLRLRLIALCLALFTASAVTACGGSSPATAPGPVPGAYAPTALPLWQRVLGSGELSGFVSELSPPKLLDLDSFIDQAKVAFIRLTPAEVRRELTNDAFRGAVISSLSSSASKDMIAASVVVQFGSPVQAERASRFFTSDSLETCRNTCNVQIARFDIPDLHAQGSHRMRSEAAAGAGDEQPFESYDVGFVDGPFVYDVFVLAPRPGMVAGNTVVAAVRALYARVHGSPPLPAPATS
jgi:hypothetical protein